MKKVIVSVTNDLATDQRVLKICDFLTRLGFDVKLTGVIRPSSVSSKHIRFKSFRFYMLFQKGFLFYAEYNVKLFFYLLFSRCHLLVSNDLDTLLPNFLVSRVRKLPLVYDSHEYFLGSTEITNRPFVRNFWERIERYIFPKLSTIITVNQSIARLYEEEYGKKLFVVRNLPYRYKINHQTDRKKLGLPEDKHIILMQGGAINIDRGAEELIQAMQPEYGLQNTMLCFIGSGDVWEKIQTLTTKLKLTDRVKFFPKMPYGKMMEYTSHCDIGVSIDKPVSLNYQYSLPNKLFDYLAAGTPVLASKMVEVQNVVEKYDVGICIDDHDPAHIAEKINIMLSDSNRYAQWRENALKASVAMCWENEEQVLADIYSQYIT